MGNCPHTTTMTKNNKSIGYRAITPDRGNWTHRVAALTIYSSARVRGIRMANCSKFSPPVPVRCSDVTASCSSHTHTVAALYATTTICTARFHIMRFVEKAKFPGRQKEFPQAVLAKQGVLFRFCSAGLHRQSAMQRDAPGERVLVATLRASRRPQDPPSGVSTRPGRTPRRFQKGIRQR